MTASRDRLRDCVPPKGGTGGTQSLTTASGTQWDAVG
jgi:hypothetical protein